MKKFEVVPLDDGVWEVWVTFNTVSSGGPPKTSIGPITADEILELFNETVPRTIEEPFLEGNPECNHAWRTWKFNNKFIVCNNCSAMKKVKRLVPRTYK